MSHRHTPLVLQHRDGSLEYRCLDCGRHIEPRIEWQTGGYAEDEFGPVRFCRRCDEWWPLEDEFWRPRRHSRTGRPFRECVACQRERVRRWHERRKAAA